MKIATQNIIGVLRLSMGFIFFWAFLDKTFGFGFATPVERAWLSGGSPTTGFLTNATKGPFAEFFQAAAGSSLVDTLFMLGLLFVGITLILGIIVRLGAITGAIMLLLMYSASAILPENNPLLDDHIIYAFIMILFITSNAGDYLGFGKKWGKTLLVKNFSFLK